MPTPTTLASVSDILLQDVDPVIQSQIFKKTVALSQFEKDKGMRPMENNTFLIDVQIYDHSGVYFQSSAATADLNFGAPKYDQMTVTAATGYGSHIITDFALTAAKGKPGSIVDLATNFGTAVQDSLRRSMNRQLLHLGGTIANNAVLAIESGSGSSSTTVTVHGPTEANTWGTQYIVPGASLHIGTDAEADGATGDTCVVDTVNSATVFTIVSSATIAASDLIKLTGADNCEMHGLENILSASNDIYGITRSTSYWSQPYIDETSEALTESDMVDALIQADKYGDVNFIITNPTLYSKYASLLVTMKRSAATLALTGGFVGLEFAAGKPGVGVVMDHDIGFGEVFFLTTPSLTIGKLDMGWLQQGGGIFEKQDLRPAWWATYKFYGNLGCLNFRANSALKAKTV